MDGERLIKKDWPLIGRTFFILTKRKAYEVQDCGYDSFLITMIVILTAAMVIKNESRQQFWKKRAVPVTRDIGRHLLLHAGIPHPRYYLLWTGYKLEIVL